MIFKECNLKGAYLIDLERHEDSRGYFSRTFCKMEFMDNGIDFNCAQCDISVNTFENTLRGMHYQKEPYMEAKIVQCIKGSIYDVIIDLRKDSPTYLKWQGFNLDADSKTAIYIPKYFAHGFLTLCDNTEVFYMMDEFFYPGYGAGIRYNDPSINIEWPCHGELILSNKDREYDNLKP